MREPLPQPEGDKYDRPNRPWTCGRSAEGDPCAFGPNPRGVCPALAECKPVEVAGQWKCDRPALRGGPCDQNGQEGPTDDGHCCRAFSCKPVRNLRSLRGILVRMACVFAVGALLMVLGGSTRNRLLAPGPLSSGHAGMLSGARWDNRCGACHSAADRTTASLLASLVSSEVGPAQSDKCMACHEKTISSEFSLAAHNLPAATLAGIAGNDHMEPQRELACAVCHQEHHGPSHAIAAMDNRRCQSCHTQKFDSFASDHPDLGMYPYARRTPIAFSHTTHAGKYFAEKNRTFTCQQCHVEDVTTGVQLTVSYANGCAECHDSDIEMATSGGVALFALPSLDVDALNNSGHAVDAWPEEATGDFDGQLPAITRLLLSADPEAREAMRLLGPEFDFFDIDTDDPAHLQASANLARALQHLLDRLYVDPSAKVKSTGAELLAGLSSETVNSAVAAWFASSQVPSTSQQSTEPGQWFVDHASLSVRYQPTGHADPILKAWIDAVVSLPDVPLRDALLLEFTGAKAMGRCTSCHSIERASTSSLTGINQATGGLMVNWEPHDRRLEPRGFTNFSHAPHLLQVELRDCTACHTVNPTADTTSNYTGYNPKAFVSDFQPVSKATCVSCHVKTAVGDSCTQCHNYHVKMP